MRFKARLRLLRMHLTRHWREQWRPAIDLGTISREKMYEIEARIRHNVVRDKKGNEWPARNALCILLLLTSPLFADTTALRTRAQQEYWDAQRVKEFEGEVRLVAKRMGIEGEVEIKFLHYPHPTFCAWTTYKQDESMQEGHLVYEMGISLQDGWCERKRSPRWLAIHEVCHITLGHLLLNPRKSEKIEESEAEQCMLDYERRKP